MLKAAAKGHAKENHHRKPAEKENEDQQRKRDAAVRRIQGREKKRQKTKTEAEKEAEKAKKAMLKKAAEAAYKEILEKEQAQTARCTDKASEKEKFAKVSEKDSLQLLRLFQISQPKSSYSEGGDRPVSKNQSAYKEISLAFEKRVKYNVRRVIPFGENVIEAHKDEKNLRKPFLGEIFQHLWAVSFNGERTGMELSENLLKISTWGIEGRISKEAKCWPLKDVRKELKSYLRKIERLRSTKDSKLAFDKREERHLRQILLTQENLRVRAILSEMQQIDADFKARNFPKYLPQLPAEIKRGDKPVRNRVWSRAVDTVKNHFKDNMLKMLSLEEISTKKSEESDSELSLNKSLENSEEFEKVRSNIFTKLLDEDKEWRHEVYAQFRTGPLFLKYKKIVTEKRRKELAESLLDEKKETEELYAKELDILRRGARVGERELRWLLQ